MACSSAVTLSSSPLVVVRQRDEFPQLRTIRYSRGCPKRLARLTHSDIVVLNEASNFLKASSFTDVIKDWKHRGICTRDQKRLIQARLRFRTPSPKPSPGPNTAAPFTSHYDGERYDDTDYFFAPDHQWPLGSPCERILYSRRRQRCQKQKNGVRLRLTLPRPPRRLHLTMPRSSFKICFPVHVVARTRAVNMARAALELLSDHEANCLPRLSLKIRFPAHVVARARAVNLAQAALGVLNEQQARAISQTKAPSQTS